MEAGKNLPPIIVHRSSMRVIDGMHRLSAAQMRGEKEIEVRFFEGDESSCYVLSVKCNISHGLPLPLADRKTAAARITEIYPEWSDRMVASVTGIAPKTVSTVRSSCFDQATRPSDQNNQLDARVGRDGRRRPRNSQQRRELAERFIQENPNASLREIAKYAGISPETARNVRTVQTSSIPGESSPVRSEDTEVISPRDMETIRRGGGRRTGTTPCISSGRNGKRNSLTILRADPAFRSTENGRSLLRMLSFSELFESQGSKLASLVPPHCRDTVAEAAAECARAWEYFAKEILEKERYSNLRNRGEEQASCSIKSQNSEMMAHRATVLPQSP
jgi:hypothetical protein